MCIFYKREAPCCHGEGYFELLIGKRGWRPQESKRAESAAVGGKVEQERVCWRGRGSSEMLPMVMQGRTAKFPSATSAVTDDLTGRGVSGVGRTAGRGLKRCAGSGR